MYRMCNATVLYQESRLLLYLWYHHHHHLLLLLRHLLLLLLLVLLGLIISYDHLIGECLKKEEGES
jgi:hypothetical protein